MLSIIQRAWNNAPLSPTERTVLKGFWGAIHTALALGIAAAIEFVATGAVHNWTAPLLIGLGVAAKSILDTTNKYVTANGEPALGTAIETLGEAAITAIAQREALSAVLSVMGTSVPSATPASVAVPVPVVPAAPGGVVVAPPAPSAPASVSDVAAPTLTEDLNLAAVAANNAIPPDPIVVIAPPPATAKRDADDWLR